MSAILNQVDVTFFLLAYCVSLLSKWSTASGWPLVAIGFVGVCLQIAACWSFSGVEFVVVYVLGSVVLGKAIGIAVALRGVLLACAQSVRPTPVPRA
jgi:hypothetical protein